MCINNTWIFPASLLAAISMLIYGNKLIGITIVVILLIRIIWLKYPKLNLICITLSTIFGCLIIISNQQMKNVMNTEVKNQQIIIVPSDMKINGGSFSGITELNGKKIMYHGYFKTKHDKDNFEHALNPLSVQVNGDLSELEKPTNINQFDLKRYYAIQKIYQGLSISEMTQITEVTKLTFTQQISKMRTKFNRSCKQLPPTLKRYCLGLISGTRELDFYDEMTGVKKLSLLHIFSISGFHVYYFLNLLTKILNMLRISKLISNLFKLIFLDAYFIFAGASNGLFRAIVMAVIVILFSIFGKKISRVDAWSVTLIINLMIFPQSLFSLACQLSYLLSLGLIITDGLTFIRQTIYLNLLSLPIILFNIYEWHSLSLLVNLLLLPFFETIIFPYLMLALLIAKLNWQAILNLFEYILKSFNDLLNIIGDLPGNIIFGKPPLTITMSLLVLTLLFIIFGNKAIKKSLIAVYTICFIIIHFPISGEVTTFDIGQGDSFLIRQPFNQSVTLIDTGGKLRFNQNDWNNGIEKYNARYTSINYLKSIGISKIDNLCLSHQDADHSGDVPAFISDFKIGNLVIPKGMDKNPSFNKKVADLSKTTQIIPVNDQDQIPGLPLSIIHPFTSGIGENKDSMVLLGEFGKTNWLFMGDLDRAGELAILDKYPNLKTDVLKVGHHGSKTSSDPEFINKIAPKYGIISAGKHNRYNHPNDETLKTLNEHQVSVLSTQKLGMIKFVFKNNELGSFKT